MPATRNNRALLLPIASPCLAGTGTHEATLDNHMIDNRDKNCEETLHEREPHRPGRTIQTRRDFLSGFTIGASMLSAGCTAGGRSRGIDGPSEPRGPADVTLRIGPVLADID